MPAKRKGIRFYQIGFDDDRAKEVEAKIKKMKITRSELFRRMWDEYGKTMKR